MKNVSHGLGIVSFSFAMSMCACSGTTSTEPTSSKDAGSKTDGGGGTPSGTRGIGGQGTGAASGSGGSSGSGGGGQCAPANGHCSAQMPCCGGAECCSGLPVQPGQEFCAANFGCPKSDRNAKHDIVPVDTDQVLERVAAMSIAEWSYNDDESSARHIGPMAQDFHAAFQTGTSDKCIPTVDANGVALAAIQALYRRVEQIDNETRRLREENADLRRELDHVRAR